jgi:hypothetical protein
MSTELRRNGGARTEFLIPERAYFDRIIEHSITQVRRIQWTLYRVGPRIGSLRDRDFVVLPRSSIPLLPDDPFQSPAI